MVRTAALIALAQVVAPGTFYTSNQNGSQWTVLARDVQQDQWGVSLWLRGSHAGDRSVPYRTSLWRVRFKCDGHATYLAHTKVYADGRSESRDYMHTAAIRPGSVTEDLDRLLCPK